MPCRLLLMMERRRFPKPVEVVRARLHHRAPLRQILCVLVDPAHAPPESLRRVDAVAVVPSLGAATPFAELIGHPSPAIP